MMKRKLARELMKRQLARDPPPCPGGEGGRVGAGGEARSATALQRANEPACGKAMWILVHAADLRISPLLATTQQPPHVCVQRLEAPETVRAFLQKDASRLFLLLPFSGRSSVQESREAWLCGRCRGLVGDHVDDWERTLVHINGQPVRCAERRGRGTKPHKCQQRHKGAP